MNTRRIPGDVLIYLATWACHFTGRRIEMEVDVALRMLEMHDVRNGVEVVVVQSIVQDLSAVTLPRIQATAPNVALYLFATHLPFL